MRNRSLFIMLRNVMIPVVLAMTLLIIAFLGFIWIRYRNSPLNPLEAFILNLNLALHGNDIEKAAGTDPALVCFTVSPGDTAGAIAKNLANQGFNIDPELFRMYVRFNGVDAQLKAGTFSISRQFNIPQIAAKLTDPKSNSITFRVIEGWRIEEIAQLIDATPGLNFRGAEFLALVGPGSSGSQPGLVATFAAKMGIPKGRSLEGFLFPDTYALPACGKADDLVARMLTNFENRVGDDLRTSAQAKGLSMYQTITLAAIIQREAVVDEERPLIGGVYFNRLINGQRPNPDAGIPTTLDADPTIQYAIGNTRTQGTWWPALTRDDYRGIQSPYNTYLNRGLPPGPIANPGLASIQGAANPTPTNYNYFRACGNEGGRHRFTVTLAEHQAACS